MKNKQIQLDQTLVGNVTEQLCEHLDPSLELRSIIISLRAHLLGGWSQSNTHQRQKFRHLQKQLVA